MKEFKFRVWVLDCEMMLEHDDLMEFTPNGGSLIVEAISNEYKEFHLMQFTGLQDINGKDIYEGDIVSSDYYDYYVPEIPEMAVVKFEIKDNFGRFGFDSIEQDAFEYGNLQVVGNIHENPELLGGD